MHNEQTRRFLNLAFKNSTHNFKKTFLQKSFRNISFIGCLFHICFLFLFISLDITPLILLNIISVALWLLTFYTAQKNWFRTTILIMVVEVIGHATLATIVLGTESGFHYYLWPALGMAMAIPDKAQKAFLGVCGCIVVIFTYLSVSHTESSYLMNYPLFQPLILTLNIFFSASSFVFTIAYFETNRTRDSKKLFELANIDEYTHTFNRRFVYLFMNQKKRSLASMGITNYALVMADINGMRDINDQYGHKVGDQVILAVTSMIKHHIDALDIVARWAGQEFLIILTNTTTEETMNVIESIQFGLYNDQKLADGMDEVTLSFGLSYGDSEAEFINVLQAADTNLHAAKRRGKNRIVTGNNQHPNNQVQSEYHI